MDKTISGIIEKSISGFYDVRTADALVRCRPRGVFRKEKVIPLVGDRVLLEKAENGSGTINEILPRKNAFIRPMVANVDLLVLIISDVNPIADPFVIDQLLVISEQKGCDAVLCINKSDVNIGTRLREIYEPAGYRVINTSAVTGEGIEELRKLLQGKISVFSGNSGVGKSSLLNALDNMQLQVGEVSDKLGRGRHTTRHVELFPLSFGAYCADTPGFSSFDIEQMEHILPENLMHLFPEFKPYISKCRFDDCKHVHEPGCAVINAVENGFIHPVRYQNYVRLFDQLSSVKAWELQKNSR